MASMFSQGASRKSTFCAGDLALQNVRGDIGLKPPLNMHPPTLLFVTLGEFVL